MWCVASHRSHKPKYYGASCCVVSTQLTAWHFCPCSIVVVMANLCLCRRAIAGCIRMYVRMCRISLNVQVPLWSNSSMWWTTGYFKQFLADFQLRLLAYKLSACFRLYHRHGSELGQVHEPKKIFRSNIFGHLTFSFGLPLSCHVYSVVVYKMKFAIKKPYEKGEFRWLGAVPIWSSIHSYYHSAQDRDILCHNCQIFIALSISPSSFMTSWTNVCFCQIKF